MDELNLNSGTEAQEMSPEQRALMKEYVEHWKRLGPLLEEQREEDVRRFDIFGSYSFFAGMVLRNLANFPAAPDSGLTEQQSWFRKLHPTSR